ncbi:MAG: HNH endonuclease signature motif containing protein [Acidobacteriota bacterium]
MLADAEPSASSSRELLEPDDSLMAGRSPRPQSAGSQPDDIDELPRVSWVILVPPAVRAAFENALDLYRRVEGGDATVVSFIESLVAEEFASDKPPDVFQAWLQAVEPQLDPQSPPSGIELPAMTMALEVLAQLDTVMSRAGVGTDSEVLWQLKCLAGAADTIERNLAAVLTEMNDNGALRELGFASIGSYAENRLGLGRTTIEDRVRVARALRGRKLLQQAYLDGAFGLEKALLVVQILGRGFIEESCEALWVSHLRACTVKRLRDEKRALLWASAVEGRTDAPMPMSDEAWLGSLRCGPGDTLAAVKRAGHAVCDEGALVSVAGSMMRLRLPVELANDFSSCIEARRQRLSLDAANCDWSQPISEEDLPSWRAARTFSAASRRLPAWVGLLAMLEEFCAAYDVAEKRSASRSEVFVRSRHRCEAPGCTARRIEWHHRHYKSRGGSDHHDNGDALCPTHHRRGQHGGYLHVSGDTPLQRIWRLGPAGSGAWYRNERRVVVVGN